MWVGSGGEGAKGWLNHLSDLKNRGVEDILIVACDGLKGLPDAITALWPLAEVQLCVGHLVRASLRYASKKYWSAITKQLKLIYTAPSQEVAEAEFADFCTEWEDKYPAMIRLWRTSWEQFTPFLAYPPELRRLVYTTNAIESLNSRFRHATRRRGHFPNEQAALKVLYLVIQNPLKNRSNITGKVVGWKHASSRSPCTTATDSTRSTDKGDHAAAHKIADTPPPELMTQHSSRRYSETCANLHENTEPSPFEIGPPPSLVTTAAWGRSARTLSSRHFGQ